MPVVDELITLLGVEADSQSFSTMEKFERGLERIEKVATITVGALAAASAAVGVWINQVAGALDETGKFADSIGDSFEAIQELEFAVQRSGGSIGELRGDLDRLVTTFAGFGAPSEILDQLATQFEGLSARQAKFYGQQLGLSESTIRLLRNGRDGLRALRMEARELGGILPPDAAQRAAEYQDELLNVQTALNGLTRGIKLRLLPTFSASFREITKFIKANREFIALNLEQIVAGISQGFSGFLDNIKAVGNFIIGLLPDTSALSGEFDTLGFTADLVEKGLTALVAVLVILKAPLLFALAKFIALGLIIDDLITYFRGGESVIGNFIEIFKTEFPFIAEIVGTVFDKVVAFVETAFERIKGVFNAFAEGGILEGLKAAGQLIIDYYVGLFDNMLTIIQGFAGKIGDTIAGSVRGALGSVGSFFGFGEEGSAGGMGFRAQVAAPSAALTPGNVSSVTNNRGGDRTANITINGARDPRAVAQETVDRAGLNVTSQTIQPGLRAPVIR